MPPSPRWRGGRGEITPIPQVLISLWLYAYSRGISSAREVARRCEYEPAFQWLCALEPISYRTLSGFRSGHQAALNDLFVQVLGMLSAEGLITLERVTLDGTKIKANAGGNTFRRKEKLEAHLQLAREQVRLMEEEAAEEEQMARRQVAARRRAARQRQSRLEAAVREVERMQREKKEDRDSFVARASSTDPEAHVMRNGEGGTVPSYNVQLLTDTAHGLIVNVDATTDAVDHHQLAPALERCEQTLGRRPQQVVADGDYTNHASVAGGGELRRGLLWIVAGELEARRTRRPRPQRRVSGQRLPLRCRAGLLHLPGGRNADSPGDAEPRAREFASTSIARPRKLAGGVHCAASAPRRKRAPPGCGRLRAARNRRRLWPSRPRWLRKKRKQIYAQRSRIAEFPHAWIKERCGLRQFRCRGLLKATLEATWAALSYNLTRWFALKRQPTLDQAALASA